MVTETISTKFGSKFTVFKSFARSQFFMILPAEYCNCRLSSPGDYWWLNIRIALQQIQIKVEDDKIEWKYERNAEAWIESAIK